MGLGWGLGATQNEVLALQEFVGGAERVTVLDGTSLVPSYYRHLAIPYIQDYFAAIKLRALFCDNGEAIRHVHFYSNGFTEAVRVALAYGAVVTYTSPAHDRVVSMEEHRRVEPYPYPFPHIFDDELFEQHSAGLRLASAVVVPSKLSQKVLEEFGCKPERLHLIPHGISDPPEKVAPFPEEFTVGYLGRTGPDKGLVYLIRAWGALNYPDAKLILAGEGTEYLEPLIRQQTDGGRFILLGRVEDPATLYNACSIYVQPSVNEGFGISVLEAMSYGRFVIASEGAGSSCFVGNAFSGFVVPPRDAKSLMEKIDLVKTYPSWYHDSTYSIRRYANKFVWEKVRAMYVELFKKLH